jgi:phosphoribosyl-AMP cyclohydrolase / phosphoribosyl-ATP pyrophosphohydrolase
MEGPTATAPDFSKGLVPAVVQDAESGQVLMVAYMDAEAWERTLATGHAWFHSRSRGLWEKGATSGNYLDVLERRLDCDADTILLKVHAHGPACHTGAESCFFTLA